MRDEPGQWNNSKSLALVEDNVEPPRLPSITADHSIRRRRYCHVHGTYQPLPAVVITTSSHQAITTNCPFGVCFFFWNLALKLLCNTCPLLSLNKSAPPAIISFFFFLIPWSWQFCSSSTLIESHKSVTKDSSNSWVGLIVPDFLDHYAVKACKIHMTNWYLRSGKTHRLETDCSSFFNNCLRPPLPFSSVLSLVTNYCNKECN